MSSDSLIWVLRRLGTDPLSLTIAGLVACAAAIVTWLALSGPPVRTAGDTPAVVLTLDLDAPKPAPTATPPETTTESASAPESAPASEVAPAPAPSDEAHAVPSSPPAVSADAEDDGAEDTHAEGEGAPAPAPPALPDSAENAARAVEQTESEAGALTSGDSSLPLAHDVPAASPATVQQATTADEEPMPVQSSALPGVTRGLVTPEPDPELLELSRFGPLPRISGNGRAPWRAYARPFDTRDKRPRIAIIVSQLGFSGAATEMAIWQLPAALTLSFASNARGLGNWVGLARAAGHEVLIEVPMEPVDFPAHDPGPDTLLTSLTTEENRTRLRKLLGRVSGYVGVVNQMGSRFTTSEPHLRPVFTELRDRGLLFVDSRSSLHSVAARAATEMHLPRAINNRFIDAELSREAIDTRLAELERIAQTSGYAVGIAQPHALTLDRLRAWIRKIEQKGFALAPISAMVNTQPD